MELDPKQFALGNNLLGSYDLVQDNQSRVSIYYSNDGGRLTNAITSPAATPMTRATSAPTGGRTFLQMCSVSLVRTTSTTAPNFCYAYKPSTQTSFGVYSWIGNGFATGPTQVCGQS